jgi:hypothetical protein
MLSSKEQFYIEMNKDQPVENGWKAAIIDELVTCHLYQREHENNPSKALQDCIQWNVDVALDPLVSSSAAELIEQGKRSLSLSQPFISKQSCKTAMFVWLGGAVLSALFSLDKTYNLLAIGPSLGAAWMSYVAYKNATY